MKTNKSPISRTALLLATGLIGLLVTLTVAANDAAVPPASGSYQIRNEKFGDLLRPQGAKRADGTPIVLYPAQPWKCMTWKVEPTDNDSCQIQNHFTGKTIEIKAEGTEHRAFQIGAAKDSLGKIRWKFTRLASGLYQISDPKTGEALTAVAEAGSVHIVTSKWEDRPEQRWKLEKINPDSLTM